VAVAARIQAHPRGFYEVPLKYQYQDNILPVKSLGSLRYFYVFVISLLFSPMLLLSNHNTVRTAILWNIITILQM